MNKIDQLLNEGAKWIETPEIKELREGLEKASSALQLFSIVGLVASIATLFFGVLLTSVIFTPLLVGMSIVGIILSIDGFKASRKASEIASKPANFAALHILNDEDKRQHLKNLTDRALDETFILKPIWKLVANR